MSGIRHLFNDTSDDAPLQRGTVFGTVPGTRIPFVGSSMPNLKQDEADEIECSYTHFSRNFKMWDEGDAADYEAVMTKVANREYALKDRRPIDVPEHGMPRIWLEWVAPYGHLPNARVSYSPLEPPAPSAVVKLNGGT